MTEPDPNDEDYRVLSQEDAELEELVQRMLDTLGFNVADIYNGNSEDSDSYIKGVMFAEDEKALKAMCESYLKTLQEEEARELLKMPVQIREAIKESKDS